MNEVNIFLWISSKAPKLRKGSFQYTLICNGQRRSGEGTDEDTTGHRLAMKAAIAALERMKRPCIITIHTDCQYLASGSRNLEEWKRNGWKKANGEKLKNAELWKRLDEVQRGHAIRYSKENVNMLREDPKMYDTDMRIKHLKNG